ncbi:MAG: flagellin [Rhodocyclaceae bacterium]|nr:flagellin [Rhodocyclaceae bacterium]
MSQVIQTNVPSLTAQRNLSGTGNALATSLQRLSSGYRINSAKDDAAGLAISERFSAQISGLNQAKRNANDGISLAQTAEGALKTSADILQRVRVLAVQSANATNSASDRQALNDEVNALTAELNRIAQTTEFNGRKMLDGSFTSALFQVGANANQTITATSGNFTTSAYGNYRIGGRVADTLGGGGDLVLGTSTSGGMAVVANVFAQSESNITAGTLTVAGQAGTYEISYDAKSSAKLIAEKVNAVTQSTGVSASARTEIELTGMEAGSSYVIELASNNSNDQYVTIAFTVGADRAGGAASTDISSTDQLASAVDSFNKQAAKTGVSARVNDKGDGITLVNDSGEDIRMALKADSSGNGLTLRQAGVDKNGNALNDEGIHQTNNNMTLSKDTTGLAGTGVTITGQVTFDSEAGFAVTDDQGQFISETDVAVGAQLQAVQTADVSTVASSNRTIALIDSALQRINTQRAAYGALQSRFTNTIANLQVTSENMSASRSRIRDTDFAEETAELTRAQILQQAGTAMLSQANSLPQQVLSLLR